MMTGRSSMRIFPRATWPPKPRQSRRPPLTAFAGLNVSPRGEPTMTETAVAATPSPVPAPAGLSHDAYSRLDPSEQGADAQVKKSDGDGSHWVRRETIPAEAPPSSPSPPSGRPQWAPATAWNAETGSLNVDEVAKWWAEQVQPALDWH